MFDKNFIVFNFQDFDGHAGNARFKYLFSIIVIMVMCDC